MDKNNIIKIVSIMLLVYSVLITIQFFSIEPTGLYNINSNGTLIRVDKDINLCLTRYTTYLFTNSNISCESIRDDYCVCEVEYNG